MAIESSPFQKAQQAVQSPAERLVDTAKQGSEEGELSLRPKRLSEYIGQNKMKEQLSISLTAAKMRGEALDHLLLHSLQENLSPGYLDRQRSKAQKDWQQGYWWTPGETAPDRAPDVSAIGGN